MIFIFSNLKCFGQLYEKIYAESTLEVQNTLNQNKNSGVDILTGIKAHHVIGLTGIGISNYNLLKSELQNSKSVISFQLKEDVTSIIIESQADFTKETFIELIAFLNGKVIGYTVEYYINE